MLIEVEEHVHLRHQELLQLSASFVEQLPLDQSLFARRCRHVLYLHGDFVALSTLAVQLEQLPAEAFLALPCIRIHDEELPALPCIQVEPSRNSSLVVAPCFVALHLTSSAAVVILGFCLQGSDVMPAKDRSYSAECSVAEPIGQLVVAVGQLVVVSYYRVDSDGTVEGCLCWKSQTMRCSLRLMGQAVSTCCSQRKVADTWIETLIMAVQCPFVDCMRVVLRRSSTALVLVAVAAAVAVVTTAVESLVVSSWHSCLTLDSVADSIAVKELVASQVQLHIGSFAVD